MTRTGRVLVTLLLGAAVAGGVGYYVMRPHAPVQPRGPARFFAGNQGPVPVLAAPARTADVPVYIDGVGTAKALNTVTVRPQVDGKLISINFKEGQDVAKGDVLAKIDPTTYQAQLDQAVAKKAQDEAQLANAKLDLERYTRLAATNAVTKQQADTQKATVAQFEALVQLDQAAVDNARAMLAYTTIAAPISGRTGIRQVDAGNIVHASDATGIVVITQVKPISVLFNLPQQRLGEINKAFAQRPLPVDVVAADNSVLERGKLTVIDNQVDQTTGTIRLKAEFPNTGLQLWPGQFVNVRLLIDTLQHVVVVPTAAVQRGPNGTFVFVVQPDSTVKVQLVTLTQQDDVQSVIATGVAAGESMVTTGFAQLADGKQVRVADANAPSAPPPGRTPGARRNRNGAGGAPDASRGNGARRPEAVGRGSRNGASPEATSGSTP